MSMKKLKLACIGECMIELQETGPGETKQTFGGDTLNTAIYCARLAKDLPLQVDYVTALGTDNFSTRMKKFWEKEGVSSCLVQQQQGELPGLYYIELDETGERIFHYWRNNAAAKKCFEYPDSLNILEKLATYDGIYLSGISLAIYTETSRNILLHRLKELASRSVPIYFDCNYRHHLWSSKEQAIEVYKQLYQISDIVFLTTEEADILLPTKSGNTEVHQQLHAFGAKESVIKDGDKPCSIEAAGKRIEVPPEIVEHVVDTTAAGDSFSGVYLVARHFGCSPQVAAKMAHKTAAYVICHKGAIAPINEMPVSGIDITECKQ